MLDKEKDQGDRQEVKEAKAAPEVQRSGVIGDTGNQARWNRAQQAHYLGQDESATDLFREPSDKKKGVQKFELFDSNAEELQASFQEIADQALIASNRTPNVSNLEQMQQYHEPRNDSDVLPPDAIVAKNLRDHALGTEIVRVAMPSGVGDRVVFPYRGAEDARLKDCTKENPEAWNSAFESFSGLKQYLSTQDATNLMKALVRNEIHNYDVQDAFADRMAKQGHVNQTETLGYAQITPAGLKQFKTRYPQLKEFLTSKGYSGLNDEAKALCDPACVPMIVAAKLQSEVDTLKTAHDKLQPNRLVEINVRTLAYTYNADVYYDPNVASNPDFHANVVPKAKGLEHLRGYDKAYPTSDERVLSKSQHVKNVAEHMRLLH